MSVKNDGLGIVKVVHRCRYRGLTGSYYCFCMKLNMPILYDTRLEKSEEVVLPLGNCLDFVYTVYVCVIIFSSQVEIWLSKRIFLKHLSTPIKWHHNIKLSRIKSISGMKKNCQNTTNRMNRLNTGDKTMYLCARTGPRIEPLPINHCLPGMGVSTVSAARILRGQMEGGSGEETMLAMDTFPYVALSKVTKQSCWCSLPTPFWTALRNSDEHGQQGMT